MKTSRIEKCVNEAWKKVIKDYNKCYIWWPESDWVASMYFHLRNSLKNMKAFRVVTEYRPDRPKDLCNKCPQSPTCDAKEKYTTQENYNSLDLAIVSFSEKLNNYWSGIPEHWWFRQLWCITHTPIIAIQFKCDNGRKLRNEAKYQKQKTTVLMKDILILNDMISRWNSDYGFMFVVSDLDSNFDAYFPDKSLKQISEKNREKIKLGILNFKKIKLGILNFSEYPNESEIHSLNHFKKNWDKL